MEDHSTWSAIRRLKGAPTGLSQTVSEEGVASEVRNSNVTVATCGIEKFDLWTGNGAWEGSGRHLDRSDMFM